MKLIADENIPMAEALFSSLAEVQLLAGRTISAEDVNDVDFLVVRSITKVNQTLLENSRVQFVGTCTIGTDHIDTNYLQSKNIAFSSAPGCNANAVVQYVVCALSELACLDSNKKVAVVGCGNVGGRVYRALSALGFDCVGIDPYLDQSSEFTIRDFNTIYDADIVCLHTPLVRDGKYPTENLINYACLKKLKSNAVLISAGRGECINNTDLLRFCEEGGQLQLVLDVWANEPNIDVRLFPFVALGTPHIAGYSYEGKVVGAIMVFEALARHMGKSEAWIYEKVEAFRVSQLGESVSLERNNMSNALKAAYSIRGDHERMAAALVDMPEAFDRLRKTYPVRREFSHYRIAKQTPFLSALGFLN